MQELDIETSIKEQKHTENKSLRSWEQWRVVILEMEKMNGQSLINSH